MAGATITNKFGTLTGWSKITCTILGRDIEGIKRVYYDDNVPKTNAYGSGEKPIGRERGSYEANAGFELYQEEVMALLKSLPEGVRLQDIPAFDLVVQYELPDGTIYRDRIKNCEFTNSGRDVKQGDGSVVTDYKLICSDIIWNAAA